MAKKSGVVSGIGGATVFIDKNGDGIQGDGEVSVTCNDDGTYTLTGKGKDLKGNFVAVGGTDLATGEANTQTLIAPPNSKVVNSLTTLIHTIAEETGVSVAAATKDLRDALDIQGVNLLKIDPVTLLEQANAGTGKAAKAMNALAALQQVDTILEMGLGLLGGAASDVAADDLQSALFSSLIDQIVNANAPLDLTGSSLIGDILSGSATALSEIPNIVLSDTFFTTINSSVSSTAAIIANQTFTISESFADVLALGNAAELGDITTALLEVTTMQNFIASTAEDVSANILAGDFAALTEISTNTANLDQLITALIISIETSGGDIGTGNIADILDAVVASGGDVNTDFGTIVDAVNDTIASGGTVDAGTIGGIVDTVIDTGLPPVVDPGTGGGGTTTPPTTPPVVDPGTSSNDSSVSINTSPTIAILSTSLGNDTVTDVSLSGSNKVTLSGVTSKATLLAAIDSVTLTKDASANLASLKVTMDASNSVTFVLGTAASVASGGTLETKVINSISSAMLTDANSILANSTLKAIVNSVAPTLVAKYDAGTNLSAAEVGAFFVENMAQVATSGSATYTNSVIADASTIAGSIMTAALIGILTDNIDFAA